MPSWSSNDTVIVSKTSKMFFPPMLATLPFLTFQGLSNIGTNNTLQQVTKIIKLHLASKCCNNLIYYIRGKMLIFLLIAIFFPCKKIIEQESEQFICYSFLGNNLFGS